MEILGRISPVTQSGVSTVTQYVLINGFLNPINAGS